MHSPRDSATLRNRLPIHQVYDVFLRHFRVRRLEHLYRSLRIVPTTRLLDLGGNSFFWDLAVSLGWPIPIVTIVNLIPNRDPLPAGIRWVVADGTQLPFRGGEFDVVFCNSVIEHLGSAETRSRFAREARRVGRRLFVQTPNRYFPIEPHLMCPFIHWLPKRARRHLLRYFTIWGLVARPSGAQCRRFLDEVHLLSRCELQELFPGARIHTENWLGLAKSLIASGPTANADR
jgi:SAM-dependent methyltransferase